MAFPYEGIQSTPKLVGKSNSLENVAVVHCCFVVDLGPETVPESDTRLSESVTEGPGALPCGGAKGRVSDHRTIYTRLTTTLHFQKGHLTMNPGCLHLVESD